MKSRYIRTYSSKLPRHRRSKKMYGSFEDSNRWIRCWNCNFPIDTMRGKFSGSSSGNVYSGSTPDPVTYEGGPTEILLEMDTMNEVGVLLETGADGQPITDYYSPAQVTAARGCPFCGCTNLP